MLTDLVLLYCLNRMVASLMTASHRDTEKNQIIAEY
jgi:hypothetical protein